MPHGSKPYPVWLYSVLTSNYVHSSHIRASTGTEYSVLTLANMRQVPIEWYYREW